MSTLQEDKAVVQNGHFKRENDRFAKSTAHKEILQASLLLSNFELFSKVNEHLIQNVSLYSDEEKEQFYAEIYTDVLSKLVKSSLNSIESTFESSLNTFGFVELMIMQISKYANAADQKEIVYQYYSKIVAFVLQNDNANTFQKSFYLYVLYNRKYFQETLEKYQLLFPKINKKDNTEAIENLKYNNAYNLFVLSNENIDDIADSFVKAALSSDWSLKVFYKYSSKFLLCQNSQSKELPKNFLNTLRHSLEEAYINKSKTFPADQFEKEMLRPLIHSSKGKVCYDIYNEFSTHSKPLGTEEKGFVGLNGAYIHHYYNTTDGFSLDKLSTKLANIDCENVVDQSLIWSFFTANNFIEFFDKFARYTYPKCFASFFIQMIAQGKKELLDKTIELLDNKSEDKNQTREIDKFKGIFKNPMFWSKVNELLNEHYTVEKHIAFCHFWIFRLSQKFRSDIIEFSKGQDHYGYMKLCELSKLQDDSSSEATVSSSISAYGNTELLGIINYFISERITFDHNSENNLFEQIHQKVEQKLPQIAEAKRNVMIELFQHNIHKMVEDNPNELLALLRNAQKYHPLGTALVTGTTINGDVSVESDFHMEAIRSNLEKFLSNKTCVTPSGPLCNYIMEPIVDLTYNYVPTSIMLIPLVGSILAGNSLTVLYTAYDGIILGNA